MWAHPVCLSSLNGLPAGYRRSGSGVTLGSGDGYLVPLVNASNASTIGKTIEATARGPLSTPHALFQACEGLIHACRRLFATTLVSRRCVNVEGSCNFIRPVAEPVGHPARNDDDIDRPEHMAIVADFCDDLALDNEQRLLAYCVYRSTGRAAGSSLQFVSPHGFREPKRNFVL